MSGFHYSREPNASGQIIVGEGPAPGLPLDRLLDRGRPSLRTALEIAAHVADIECVALEDNAVHGDLRPAHVRVAPSGAVSVEGFGILRRVTRAPEGRPEQASADVYGLGLLIYTMASGEPFGNPPRDAREHDAYVAAKVQALDLGKAGQRRWAPDLRAFLAKLLAWAPADRPSPLDAANVFASIAQQCPGDDVATWMSSRSFPVTDRGAVGSGDDGLGGPVTVTGFFPKAGGPRTAPSTKGESTTFWTKDRISATFHEVTPPKAPEGVRAPSEKPPHVPQVLRTSATFIPLDEEDDSPGSTVIVSAASLAAGKPSATASITAQSAPDDRPAGSGPASPVPASPTPTVTATAPTVSSPTETATSATATAVVGGPTAPATAPGPTGVPAQPVVAVVKPAPPPTRPGTPVAAAGPPPASGAVATAAKAGDPKATTANAPAGSPARKPPPPPTGQATVSPSTRTPPVPEKAPKKGGMGKVVAIVAVLLLLAVCGGGGAVAAAGWWWYAHNTGERLGFLTGDPSSPAVDPTGVNSAVTESPVASTDVSGAPAPGTTVAPGANGGSDPAEAPVVAPEALTGATTPESTTIASASGSPSSIPAPGSAAAPASGASATGTSASGTAAAGAAKTGATTTGAGKTGSTTTGSTTTGSSTSTPPRSGTGGAPSGSTTNTSSSAPTGSSTTSNRSSSTGTSSATTPPSTTAPSGTPPSTTSSASPSASAGTTASSSSAASYKVTFTLRSKDPKVSCNDGQSSRFAGNTILTFKGPVTCTLTAGTYSGTVKVTKAAKVSCSEGNEKIVCTVN